MAGCGCGRWDSSESIALEHLPTLKTPEIYPKIKGKSSDSSKFVTVKNGEENPNISEPIISRYKKVAQVKDLTREYQSGLVLKDRSRRASENENWGEALKGECITKERILGLEDLQQNSGGRRDAAAKSFGNPDSEVISLSPKTLMATNSFICEICSRGFQRDKNLQLHRRGHNLPWKLKQTTNKEIRNKVYICPEPSCVHHHPSRAFGDLTGIKKHFCRKHGEKKWKCEKCSKRYAVQSDWKAHSETCVTREYTCDCGTLFSRYCPVGRSFVSPDIRQPQRLAEGLESWRGFYQHNRPTQMGLCLDIDMACAAFIEALPVIEFVAQLLGKDVISRPLSDSDRVMINKGLRGVKVEVTHRGNVRRKYRISGLTSQPTRELVFPVDDNSTMKSVIEYFQEMYGFTIQHTHLPCLQVGNQKKANYLPMEACKIVKGQRYTERFNEKQITTLPKVTCQAPRDRENDILQMVQHNAYDQDPYANEFGIEISEELASMETRVLPAPWLKYHETGKEKDCLPHVGHWNMMNKKMINGMTVSRWACINFSRSMQESVARGFCNELAQMCQVSGMEFNPEPVIPIYNAKPEQVEKALKHVYHTSMNKLKGKELELLLAILPDNNGSLYGDIKRICETELGLMSQCCLTKHVFQIRKHYLANVSSKINAKMAGRNTVLLDAIICRIPLVSNIPTIIFGADMTHPENEEDSSRSIAAVVASQDLPEVTKYCGLVCAQANRQELIQDLYKTWHDPFRGTVTGGMIRDLLVSCRKATGQKPLRIIFYRDGVNGGQFYQVLLYELDAIRKVCLILSCLAYCPDTDVKQTDSAHLVRAYQSGPILFNSEKKDTGEGLNRECLTKSVLSLDDSSKHKLLPDVGATENNARLVRAYQSFPVVSLSDNKNRGEALKRECITKSMLGLQDLQHHSGGRPDDAAKSFGAIYDPGIHTTHSHAQNSFEVLEALPTRKQPNDCVPLLSLGRLTLQGCEQEEKSQDLPRLMQINGVEQRVTKSPRYVGGLTAQSTSSSRWPTGLPDGRHIVVLNPLEQSIKNVGHVARAAQCSPTVPLPEKKMVRKTLKRKYRIVSVIFEIHQQHFGKRCEGTAKGLCATHICRKHGINRVSTEKHIHKQHGINQWPFRQKWATRKGYSLGEKRPYEVSNLSMDDKLVSRFLFIHMSQFPRSSPRPLALPNGSEIVGPIALSSNEFAATNNRAHLVRQNQSGSTASHYERKNTRETVGRQKITESLSSMKNRQQHFGCKHKDAVKRLGVKVSTFKGSCRQHRVYWFQCQIKKNEQEAFDATNNIAHLVKADQGIPNVSYSKMENKRGALKRECSGLSLEDLPQHYGGNEDAIKGLGDSLAWKSFGVLESLPLGERSIIRYFAQRRTLTHKHCVQRKKSQDLPRSLQMDCSGGLAAQSAVSLPDGGYILSLSEKKIVGKTLKRKCRTTSVFSLEDHQQHGVRRWEDAAKSLGRKRICRQLLIPHVSRAKRIHRQHAIHRWPFQQNWAKMKAYSVGDKRPAEVIILSTDGKLVSRLQLVHISWLVKFLPWPSALRGHGDIVGPIALLSNEFPATNNRAHGIRKDQSGSSSASHSEKKRPGEPEDFEERDGSISYEDLQNLFGMSREDAAKILKVSVSTLKRISRQHGIKRWPYRARKNAVKKPPDRHRGMNTALTCKTLSTNGSNPALSQPNPTIPHATGSSDDQRNLLASQEEPLLQGLVSGPIYGTISSCTDPALSQPTPMGNLEDQRNLLALPEEHLLGQLTPTIPPTMDGFADWSAVSAFFDDSFLEGHASGSIDFTVPACSNPAPSQPMPTNATERQNMDFVELKATYGDATIKFQLPPMFETSELKEKVSKILECDLGSFKVEYKDKDGEWILMGCDENVREYLQLLNSMGKQVPKLKISDKVPNTTNLCETCGSLTRKRPRHVQR